jgi:hypothetical protein
MGRRHRAFVVFPWGLQMSPIGEIEVLVRDLFWIAGRDEHHREHRCYPTNLVNYCIAIDNLNSRHPVDA